MLAWNDLHDYQKEAIEWGATRDRGFLWLKMGDGKTAIAAHTAMRRAAPALVVGTKRIIESVWPSELTKWSSLTGMTYSSATGSKKNREAAVASRPDLLGVSYDHLKWLIETGGHAGRPFWIFDEISKMKSHSTKRFRTLVKSVRPEQAFGLTATPACEGYGGLWAQWKAIGGDDRLGRNITEFRQLFTVPVFKGNFTDYVIPKGKEAAIRSLLSPDVFTIDDSRRPYTGVPDVIDVVIPWGTTGARARYDTLAKELVAELESSRFAVASKGVAYTKGLQLASGFIYDESRTPHTFDEEKIDAIVEATEELQGDPVLIFYQFQHERDQLLARVPGAQPLLGDNYEDFNAGKIPALVLQPKSCSHGLNLQGSRYAFFCGVPASGEEYAQCIGRINRQGQDRQPVVKRFLRENSLDKIAVLRAEGKLKKDSEVVRLIREQIS